jgi:hypothetical protein
MLAQQPSCLQRNVAWWGGSLSNGRPTTVSCSDTTLLTFAFSEVMRERIGFLIRTKHAMGATAPPAALTADLENAQVWAWGQPLCDFNNVQQRQPSPVLLPTSSQVVKVYPRRDLLRWVKAARR